jgi:ArsR family transcriptional regulator
MGKKKKQEKTEKIKKNKEKKNKAKKLDKKLKTVLAEEMTAEEGRTAPDRPEPADTAVHAPEEEGAAAPKKSQTQKARTRRSSGSHSEDNARMAEILRAFGDVNRLQILDLLQGGELCARDLLEAVDIVQSTLSHHMKILVDAGIVRCRKQGKWSYYSINHDTLALVSEYTMKWS